MNSPYMITLPSHPDASGVLTVADRTSIPFIPKRAFWITGMSGERGNHAHINCKQFIVALQGRAKVSIHTNDGIGAVYFLEREDNGLFVPTLVFISIKPLTDDAILLVLASDDYDPEDYVYSIHETTTLAAAYA